MHKIGYLYCQTGIAGDMCLGALVNSGVPLKYLMKEPKFHRFFFSHGLSVRQFLFYDFPIANTFIVCGSIQASQITSLLVRSERHPSLDNPKLLFASDAKVLRLKLREHLHVLKKNKSYTQN